MLIDEIKWKSYLQIIRPMNIYYNDICSKDAEALDDKGLVNQYLNYYAFHFIYKEEKDLLYIVNKGNNEEISFIFEKQYKIIEYICIYYYFLR